MVSHNFKAGNLQEKINTLTSYLEGEIEKLKCAHIQELEKIKEQYKTGLQSIHENFNARWTEGNLSMTNRLMELEEHLGYLRELNAAQRLMMEDNLTYIRTLEEKLGDYNGSSGKMI